MDVTDEIGNQALNEIKEAFATAKVWVPIICLPSPHIFEDDSGTYCVTDPSSNIDSQTCNSVDPSSNIDSQTCNSVDLIRLMRMSRDELEIIQQHLQSRFHYPPKTIIRLEGVKGLEDKDKARQLLFKAALEKGTELGCRSTTEKMTPFRKFTMHIGCSRCYRNRKGSKVSTKHVFKEGKIQACNTLIGKEHKSFVSKHKRHFFKKSDIANQDKDSMVARQTQYKTLKKGGLKNRMLLKSASTKEEGCDFALTLILSRSDDLWYIAYDVRMAVYYRLNHKNHFPIDPKHMWISQKSMLSDKCKQFIEDSILKGIAAESIVQMVFVQFQVNIKPSVVRNMGNSLLNQMYFFDENDPDYNKTAAEKLRILLKNTENVSYIILKHHPNSGFVTYTREKKEKVSLDEISLLEAESWRKQLMLTDSDELLVSCAWVHDEERRKASMFPEYLSVDTTFGLNKQKRAMFMAVGTDGNNKVFTAFRSWMPSRQKSAFFWTMNQAMPILLGTNTSRKIKMISSDSELSLVQAIKGSINSSDANFSWAKFRSDYFHFFELTWKKLMSLLNSSKSPTMEFIHFAGLVKGWIKSWFCSILTKDELKISHTRLKRFLLEKLDILGRTFYCEIQKIITSIMASQEDLLHYAFRYTTTFGFLGASIVESMNGAIKGRSLYSVDGKMTLGHSTLQLLKQTEHKSLREKQNLTNELNANHSYLNVDLSEVLTKYMVDIVAKNFDARDNYHVRRKSDELFWVISKSSLEKPERLSCIPSFIHLHEVTIDGSFITCSCGYVNQYLSPCRHVMAVIKDKQNLSHELVHYRWWKQFEYYYRRDFANDEILSRPEIKAMRDKMEQWVSFIDDNAFDVDGNFRGCYLSDDNLKRIRMTEYLNDTIFSLMKRFKLRISRYGALVKENVSIEELLNGTHRTKYAEENQAADINPNEVDGFSGDMSMDISLSQQETDKVTIDNEGDNPSYDLNDEFLGEVNEVEECLTERGSDAWHHTQEALNVIKTKQQELEWIQLAINFKYKHLKQNSKDRDDVDTSVFGSDLTNTRAEGKRKRYIYERR